jgi:hypothetical protein
MVSLSLGRVVGEMLSRAVQVEKMARAESDAPSREHPLASILSGYLEPLYEYFVQQPECHDREE